MLKIRGQAFEKAISSVQQYYPALTGEFFRDVKPEELNASYFDMPQRFNKALAALERGVEYLASGVKDREAQPLPVVEGQLPYEAQAVRRLQLQTALKEDYNATLRSMYDVFVKLLQEANGIKIHLDSYRAGHKVSNLCGESAVMQVMTRNLLHSCMEGQNVPFPEGAQR